MKAIYLDCFAGVSGNMLLGAFIQLGVPVETLTAELAKLRLDGEGSSRSIWQECSLNASTVDKHGISAVYVDVDVHGHHHHGDNDGHHHRHRSFADIQAMVERSPLAEGVKRRSLDIFRTLAVAEGKVHGAPPDEVHFHEVGAIDSLVDIVGTAICLEHLNVGRVYVGRVNTGSGAIHCAHGVMAVPAPATCELLLGFPTYHCNEGRELTTPTGAAILKTLADFADPMPIVAERIGYGAGTWDLPDKSNVLRVFLGDDGTAQGERLVLLQTNLDDCDGQLLGYVQERLWDAGALDVWTAPIGMKKNRPGVLLSVLAPAARQAACEDLILGETTSLGVRCFKVYSRTVAEREFVTAATEYGDVRCKVSRRNGRVVTMSAEYDDCRRLALERGVPLKAVRAAALSQLGIGS